MDQTSASAQVTTLMPQYQTFCEAQYAEWSKINRAPSIIDFPHDVNKFFDTGEERTKRWHAHMTPLSIAWWAAHGFTYEKKALHAVGTLTHAQSGMCLTE